MSETEPLILVPNGQFKVLPPLKPLQEPISFSVTELEMEQRCRRQWVLGSFNQYALSALIPAVALDFGSIWHAAHFSWIKDESKTLEQHLLIEANLNLDKIRANYLRQIGTSIAEAELENIYDAIGLGQTMADNYQTHWGGPLPESVRLVEAEQKILTAIPGTFHCACLLKGGCQHNCAGCQNTVQFGVAEQPYYSECGLWPVPKSCCQTCGDHVYLESKLDGIVEGLKSGRYFVLERKTYGARPNMEHLETNEQFLKYFWVLDTLTGKAGGIFYDGAWKHDGYDKRFKPPRKVYALEDLFLRHTMLRNEYEVQEMVALMSAKVIELCNPNLVITRYRQWQGCWDCSYNRLCTAISKGEAYDQLLQEHFTLRVPD